RDRRRRLRRQALFAEGAGRPGPGGPAARAPGPGVDRALGGADRPRRGPARGERERPGDRAHTEGVRSAPGPARVGRPRALARISAEPRVGLRPRGRDRVADGGRARPAPAREARRRREPDRDGQVGRLSLRDRPAMIQAFVHFLRRSIARKLTVTLVGFVAVTMIVAGPYLNRALEAFALDTLEARLASIGRLLHDDARTLIRRNASPQEFRAFALRGSRPTASRVTVIAADGRVLGDSDVPVEDLPGVENH